MTEQLVARWVAVVGETGRPAAIDLLARYGEPHRRYHDVRHLTEVLDAVDELAADAADPDAVRLAAWFHDAVYETEGAHAAGGPSNEEASARLAEQVLGRLTQPAELVAEVARLVRLTETHAAAQGDANAAVLCDADLAILAAEPARYLGYTQAVREEYRSVPDELFRPARAQILGALLAAPSLYRTPFARARFEQRARANVTAELARLAHRDPDFDSDLDPGSGS